MHTYQKLEKGSKCLFFQISGYKVLIIYFVKIETNLDELQIEVQLFAKNAHLLYYKKIK